MKVRGAKTLTLGLIIVMVCASLAHAATYWADREYPYIITGYSNIVLDGDTATAFSVTYTDYNEPYDELRAHCQLWEDGHFLASQTEIVETFGWRLIYSHGDDELPGPLQETSSYDGNFWVYGVHRGILYSMENDITSDGYLSTSKGLSGSSLTEWNAISMAIAKSSSSDGAILVPWHELRTLVCVLGKDLGNALMIAALDTVTPRLEKGDYLPTVAVDQEATQALVYVPQESGGHRVIRLDLPGNDTPQPNECR